MLQEDQILANKTEFINLLNTITRPNANIPRLINDLETSDFFTAPASTKYHCNYKGGLCQHSLNVYRALINITKAMNAAYTEESLLIISLLHDMAKINTYEEGARNQKIYTPTGSKKDELGKFEWVSTKVYQLKDQKNRFFIGNHEQTSEFMVSQYIPLSIEETAAIMTHHGGLGNDCVSITAVSSIYTKYPLAAFLHTADLLSSFYTEAETDEQTY